MSANDIEKLPACLLCLAEAAADSSYGVYYTVMPHSGSLLLNAIQRVVRKALDVTDTSLLCFNCFSLFEQLDLAEEKCKELRTTITTSFHGDSSLDEVLGIGCQTDDNVGQPTFPCTVCDECFERRGELRRHMVTAHRDVKPFACDRCGQTFRTKAGANIHANKKHGALEPKREFVECAAEAAPEDDDLEDDFELGSGVTALTQDECADVTLKPELGSSSGDEEAAKSDEDGEYADEHEDWIDQDAGNSQDAWEAGAGAEEDEEEAVGRKGGRTGGKAGRRKKASERPVRQKKPTDLVPLNCSICGKAWRTRSELRSHEATHSTERPFICEVCGQAYKHKPALDVHVGMHRGINPFCCPYCNKSFTQKGALQRHLPIHTGDAPFQCELCGKRFVHHTSFNMHTLAHTGEKSYKCGTCGLALLSASHLKRHTRVHTGERPYQCPTCGKRFAERYNLAAHQRIHMHSAGKTHSCQLCGAGFDRKPKLEDHLASCHNKIGEERRPAAAEPSWHHLVFDPGNKMLPPESAARLGLGLLQ